MESWAALLALFLLYLCPTLICQWILRYLDVVNKREIGMGLAWPLWLLLGLPVLLMQRASDGGANARHTREAKLKEEKQEAERRAIELGRLVEEGRAEVERLLQEKT